MWLSYTIELALALFAIRRVASRVAPIPSLVHRLE